MSLGLLSLLLLLEDLSLSLSEALYLSFVFLSDYRSGGDALLAPTYTAKGLFLGCGSLRDAYWSRLAVSYRFASLICNNYKN